MNRVIVTGGAGFVGSNLIKHLLDKYPDIQILSLDNYSTGKKENHVDSPNVTYKKFKTTDINKSMEIQHFGAEIIFHFGEYSRIVTSFKDSEYVMHTNLNGTSQVLEFCKQNNVKLIYSASSSIFGNKGKDENLAPYSWTKSKMVELIKNYHDWFGVQYEICYFFNVYGPGQIMSGDYATVIGIFERQMLAGEPLTVVSPGTQSRDFTHVDDIVRGVEKSVHMNLNREWMLRSGKSYEIAEVAKMFDCEWELIPERRGERYASEKFESDTNEILGWEPENALENWIKSIKTKDSLV
jgi:UDP-glucose 4-epimerase